ncbi:MULTISPECIES: M10 family metallopeptidase [unclassified Chelatococcus]|uniref:M10 family metallopeptidase n=1 Tax=unclassified Chelatococcus TaxID=2638111 RepID=UPI001BCD87D4|nr:MULTISPECIES: M10 family metallopeptidase [unclassified Chelatococcus]MBS7696809.1 M10 family metallopeptidase [Chelatococcus sp. YT9]MBX3558353.1 M10 family metallopeptidase [Chelatococcus sp.]
MSIASNIPTGNRSIDGLIHEYRWGSKIITYSFPSSLSEYGDTYPVDYIENFRELDKGIKEKTREFFREIEKIIDIRFYEYEANPGRAIIRIAQCRVENPCAYLPTSHHCAGDVWFPVTDDYREPDEGSFEHHAIRHEIGHALGLKHPHNLGPFGRVPQEHDSSRFTVMSYNNYRDHPSLGCSRDEHPQSFMPLDVLALQTLYGQPGRSPTSGTDNSYSWDPAMGHSFRDGYYRHKASGNYVFETIVDDGGWDTFDFSNFNQDLNIDLRPGTASHIVPRPLKYGEASEQIVVCTPMSSSNDSRFLIEATIGGGGNDTIMGNDCANHLRGGAGNDRISGYDGDDCLEGNEGDDVLWGGRGKDFLAGGTGRNLFFIAPGDGHDVIQDFKRGSGNVIDLRRFGLRAPEDVEMLDTSAFGGSVTLHLVASDGGGEAELTLIGMTAQEVRSDSTILLF